MNRIERIEKQVFNGIRKTITWYLENKNWMNQIKKENHTLNKMGKE